MPPNPWHRSNLTALGLGRGLVIPTPRAAMTQWSDGTYTVTGPDDRTTTGLTLDGVREWCNEAGVERPGDGDLAWLHYGERSADALPDDPEAADTP